MGNASRITVDRLRELLHYDPETGVFTRRVDVMCGRHMKQFAARAGDVAGSPSSDGRLQIRLDKHNYKAHQLAWLYVHGEWPPSEVDHKDTDPMNNRIDNLRLATRRINNQNLRQAQKNNRLGILGVKAQYRKFVAQITINGKNTYLGMFDTADAAHEAYLTAKRIHHEGCTL